MSIRKFESNYSKIQKKRRIETLNASQKELMKDYLVSFLDYEYGKELFKENSRKSLLDIKIVSYLDVNVPFQEFNKRRDSLRCLEMKITRT